MRVVEFETDAEKDIIRIPENYKELYSKHLKIIAIVKDEEKETLQIELENKKFLSANYNAVIENDSEEDKIWEKYL